MMLVELTAVGGTTVALPLERDEIGQVVVEAHAVAGSVAPVVHLAASGKCKFGLALAQVGSPVVLCHKLFSVTIWVYFLPLNSLLIKMLMFGKAL